MTPYTSLHKPYMPAVLHLPFGHLLAFSLTVSHYGFNRILSTSKPLVLA